MHRTVPFLCIALILGATAGICTYGIFTTAPVVDEPPHIAAGYSYVTALDYRLNPEHPPLTKLLSGIAVASLVTPQPLLAVTTAPWQQGINEQWYFGRSVLYDGETDPLTIVRAARIAPLCITLLFIAALAWWVWRRYGPWYGVAMTALFGLSPLVLGHGYLVTTDIAAAGGAFVALATFGRMLTNPRPSTYLYAGLAFGIAQIAKFSLILLLPTYLLMTVLYVWAVHQTTIRATLRRVWGTPLVRIVGVIAIGYFVIVLPLYTVLTWRYPVVKQHTDTAFLLSSFAGGATPSGSICKPVRCAADLVVWASAHPALQPAAAHALGVLMVIQRSAGGSTTYFLGHVSSAGSVLYFPLIYLLKETLPALLVIVGAGVALGLWWFFMLRQRTHSTATCAALLRRLVREHTIETVFALFVLLYTAASLRSSLNIGLRHLAPIIPLMYILGLAVWRSIIIPRYRTAGTVLLTVLITAQLVTTASAAPFFLAYFNPLAGGAANGYRYAVDSNYDWGQDLLLLRAWLAEHPDVGTIAVDYFGGGDLSLLGPRARAWESADGSPTVAGMHVLVVSVSKLQSALQPLAPGEPRSYVSSYQWLEALHPRDAQLGSVPPPDERIGTSLMVYRLPDTY